mmetsp:Transcript_83039/g.216487  ORF Transcript_83039/g.216487 Transcript_83039/m.216487 type:complete len:223 (+) Transcript_83039:51-719(+)
MSARMLRPASAAPMECILCAHWRITDPRYRSPTVFVHAASRPLVAAHMGTSDATRQLHHGFGLWLSLLDLGKPRIALLRSFLVAAQDDVPEFIACADSLASSLRAVADSWLVQRSLTRRCNCCLVSQLLRLRDWLDFRLVPFTRGDSWWQVVIDGEWIPWDYHLIVGVVGNKGLRREVVVLLFFVQIETGLLAAAGNGTAHVWWAPAAVHSLDPPALPPSTG